MRGLDVVWGDCNEDDIFREVTSRLDGREVDYLFIDADHSYGGIWRSFELYSPLVRRGGIVILDDVICRADSHGIWRLAPELQERYATKIISGARTNYVSGEGILVVYL